MIVNTGGLDIDTSEIAMLTDNKTPHIVNSWGVGS